MQGRLRKISNRYSITEETAKIAYNQLMENDSNTLHNKALTHRDLNLEKYPLSQLVFGLCPQPNNHLSRQNQIIKKT